MKAVVMEGKKRICVVLCEDGTFRKIRGNYSVGETIEVKASDFITEESNMAMLKKSLPILSGLAAAAVLVTSVGYYETAVACSYVTLDATPSIEYTLNRLDKVIKVEALNEEAQPIIETLTHQGVKYNSIGDAIDMTVEVLRANDYLSEDSNEIIIDVVSESDGRQEKLSKQVEKSLAGSDTTLNISLLKSDKEDRASAKGSGISTGQFKAMKEGKIKESTPAGGSASNSGTVASSAASTIKKQPVTPPPVPSTSDDSQTSDSASSSAYTPPSQASTPSAPASKPHKKKKKKAASEGNSGDTEVAAATEGSNESASSGSSSEAGKENSGEASTTPGENTEAPTGGSTSPDPAPTEQPTPTEDPTPSEDPGTGGSEETPEPPAPPAPPAPPVEPEPPVVPDPTDEPTLPEIPDVPAPDPAPVPGQVLPTPVPDQPSAFDDTADSAAESVSVQENDSYESSFE
ncbi:anti-sigma factor domain-containing protein [Butyrivibrio sp. MC2021]|uniref:anti-sigma factor domain-containing protein n=1 Tax=Butyrivibrio sp. MC2021 TaxID=1408306 RepID=UPI000478F2FD|nr:anti-sigma factor domain-containing protein [Butyrivibrio sp. MC2021]